MSQYFDPLGETEPNNTCYKLTTYIPQRPPPKWLPDFFTRENIRNTYTESTWRILPDNTNPDLDCFQYKDLDTVPTKSITIKSAWFPAFARCRHLVADPDKRECNHGCYFLEKGGGPTRWSCDRSDCEGHVYMGRIQEEEQVGGPEEKRIKKVACFGEKGKRMVCLNPLKHAVE
jgi:hypothetical protein